jgi:putative spermidine/putrescine transport system ATP-binding protein
MKRRSTAFYLQLGLTLLVCAFLVVPVVQSVMAGLTANYIAGIKSGLTLKWFAKVWELYRDTIFRSLAIGLTCLAACLVLGVPAAYAMAKWRNRFTRWFEELLVMPLAIPGLATALALIITYGGFTDFRRSWVFILVGHVIFTLPFMVRAVIAVLASMNFEELEESAASLGAGFWNRFFRVVIPNAAPGILAGSLMVLTLSVGEFNLTWMLHTPLTKTLPVGLADSYASMRLEIGSAYTLVFFVMIIPLLLAMQWLARPRQHQQRKMQPEHEAATVVTSFCLRRDPMKANRQPSGTSVRIHQCAKTFGDGTRALEHLDLEVAAGETLVILGPSGCGKTTLLRIIAGLESPDFGGRVFFGDQDVTGVPIEKRHVGMVFQSYALFPNMNVAGNVAYGLKVRGIEAERREQRVNEMLAMMKIEDLRNREVNQLSGGQKQRVALARAIAVRPRVLLLDEPLTALDAKLRESLRMEIDTLLRSLGITAIYVTHDQGEAMALGDRIVVMNTARVVQVGTPREIYFHPENRFVAEFVGAVNRLVGQAIDGSMLSPYGRIPLQQVPGLAVPESGEIQLFFRPENVDLVPPGEGHLRATVAASFFMGSRTRLVLNGSTADVLTVETAGHQVYRPGDQVGVRIAPNGIIRLP